MDTGGFNRVIRIERRVQMGTKALGDPNFVWEEFATIFCQPKVTRGREHFDSATKQRYGEDVYLFRCHYSDVTGIDATMEIVDEDGARLDIKSIRPDTESQQDCIVECTLQDPTLGAVALMGYVDDVIPDGANGVAYDGFSVKAKGGTAPYTFTVVSGALPTGLAISGSTGAISGTPSAAGTFNPAVKVTDSVGDTHTMPAMTITIAA